MTGEEVPHPGIPVLTPTPKGKIVEKSVRVYTVKCPECHVPAEYSKKAEPVCPECGMICAGPNVIKEDRTVIDSQSAGRVDGSRSS